jgi:hypothetical protein
LKSRLPLCALGRMTGFVAGTTLAGDVVSFPGSPKVGRPESVSLTVRGLSLVVGTGQSGLPPLIPTRNIRSLA